MEGEPKTIDCPLVGSLGTLPGAGFLLSVAMAGTMNPKAGTIYYAQPVAELLCITDHCGYNRNLYTT